MKGRAHPPSSSESDDWGDESWTVDCPCGVNFDDGEEMVDCDECGVWVHTSCCRILKGHTSYVCDKCKLKKKKETEESEVAQLLVELPTKTPAFEEKSMEKAEFYSVPLRTGVDLSLEDRAHIQGIPGGDARLFVGVSQVFSRQLWKYTGYVPKVLRFDYHELPEWPEEKPNAIALLGDVLDKHLLGEALDKQVDNPVLGSAKKEHTTVPEDERHLEEDTQQAMEVQTEHNQSSKEKHGKRELRKGESKHGNHRHKVHGSKEDKGHHHGKRRRDESGKKDSGSRKRVKNAVDGSKANEETTKKVCEEAAVPFRSSRPAPKNPKAMRKLAVQTFMDGADGDARIGNDCSKAEILAVHASESHGYTNGETGYTRSETSLGQECPKSLDRSRNTSRDMQDDDGNEERGEEFSSLLGTSVPNSPTTAEADLHHEEAEHHKRGVEELLTHSKHLGGLKPTGPTLDVLPGKEHSSNDVGTDGKCAMADQKENLQRSRSNSVMISLESNKQVGAMIDEQPDGSAESGKFFQDHLSTSPQQQPCVPIQSAPVQPVKHVSSEEILNPLKQQAMGHKQVASTEVHNLHQLQSVKHLEQSRCKLAKSTHHRLYSTTDASHPTTEERICINDQPNQEHVEELLHEQNNRVEELLPSQDGQVPQEKSHKAKGQDQKPSSPSSPCQQIFQQEANVTSRILTTGSSISTNASGKLHVTVEESSNTSPLSIQTVPLRSSSNVNSSSSPTSSCPGVGSKQQGFVKSNSVSPPSEKTGNVVLASVSQPGLTSKPTLGSLAVSPPSEKTGNVVQPVLSSKPSLGSLAVSNSKGSVSLGAKPGTPPANTSLKNASLSKHRSRTSTTPDTKKADTGITATKPSVTSAPDGHSTEAGISCARQSSKESTKPLVNTANKVTPLGKALPLPASAKHPVHSKGHNLLASSKQIGQHFSKQESGLIAATTEPSSLPPPKQPTKQVSNSTSLKGEKSGITVGSAVSKTSVLPPPHPAGTPDRQFSVTNFAPPTLNDEELAQLLHQELNSSPRIPRVARVRQTATAPQHLSAVQASYHSAKRPAGVALPVASSASQKEHHAVSKRRMRDDSSRESSRSSLIGVEDAPKAEGLGNKKHEESGVQATNSKDKDAPDGCTVLKLTMLNTTEASSHHSPMPGIVEGQSASDLSGANDSNDGERKGSADNVLTLPGLIEEILSEKGHQASYDYICEAVLPHWPKLRKHNGERYAYTSHRQAVLDCLRNRSAWSHLIDRGPKTNVGRKRRRHESVVAVESENVEEADGRGSIHDDEAEEFKTGKSLKEVEVDGSECWPPPDKGKDIDVTLPEEVPKGKRKARRRRRLAVQAKGYGARSHHGREEGRAADATIVYGLEEDHERILSPLSEEAASNYSEEEEEILVHRGSRHVSRRQGSSVDSEDDEMDL